MASGKRQPSKQKRTQQNRQQRAARQARATNAASAGSSSSSASAKPASTSLLGRLRGAATPAPRPSAKGSGGSGGRLADRLASSPLADPSAQPVGYRAALTGLLAAVAAVAITFFMTTPVNGQGDVYAEGSSVVADWAKTALHTAEDAPEATADEVVSSVDDWMPERETKQTFIALWPMSIAMALPIVGAFLCFRSVRQRRGSKVITRTMYATLLGAFLTFGLAVYFLPAVIAISVAGFQVRKAEIGAARAAAASDEGPADDHDVIDADVVDDDVVDADADADTDRD